MEEEELRVGDPKAGGYAFIGVDGRADVELVGLSCARLINDLFQAKQKLVNAIRRQRQVLPPPPMRT